MPSLKNCPFCHHMNATMVSGPCTHTKPNLFMAQVHCGHCGGTGPRYCGEDTQAYAEARARQEWNRGMPSAPSWAERIAESANLSITFSLIALAISYFLYNQVHLSAILGFLAGAVLLRITTHVLITRARNKANRDEITELTRLQGA